MRAPLLGREDSGLAPKSTNGERHEVSAFARGERRQFCLAKRDQILKLADAGPLIH